MGNSLLSDLFRKKWVYLFLVLDVVLIAALIIINILNAMKTARLWLDIAPLDATILVDGKEYQNGTFAFMPGHYEIKVSHPELDTKTVEVDLSSGYFSHVAVFLKKDDDFSFYTLKNNYYSFWQLDSIAAKRNNVTLDNDKSAESFIERISGLYQVFDELPIEKEEYSNAGNVPELIQDVSIIKNTDDECQTFLCLKVLLLGTDDKTLVDKLLEEHSINPEDYEIHYQTY